MKNYFTNYGLGLKEAIDTAVLKFQAGYGNQIMYTEFGTVIIDLKRIQGYNSWRYRVITCTPETAPMESRLVRKCIQSGFNYYIGISFAPGVSLINNEMLLRFFVAIGMCSALANHVKKEVKLSISDSNVREIGEACAYQYMKSSCSYSFNADEIGKMMVKTNIMPVVPVTIEKITLSREVMNNYFEKIKSKIHDLSIDTDCIPLYDTFWCTFIAFIFSSAGVFNPRLYVPFREAAEESTAQTDVDFIIYVMKKLLEYPHGSVDKSEEDKSDKKGGKGNGKK